MSDTERCPEIPMIDSTPLFPLFFDLIVYKMLYSAVELSLDPTPIQTEEDTVVVFVHRILA